MRLIALATLAFGIAISGCDNSEKVAMEETKKQLEREKAAAKKAIEEFSQMRKGKDSPQDQRKP